MAGHREKSRMNKVASVAKVVEAPKAKPKKKKSIVKKLFSKK